MFSGLVSHVCDWAPCGNWLLSVSLSHNAASQRRIINTVTQGNFQWVICTGKLSLFFFGKKMPKVMQSYFYRWDTDRNTAGRPISRVWPRSVSEGSEQSGPVPRWSPREPSTNGHTDRAAGEKRQDTWSAQVTPSRRNNNSYVCSCEVTCHDFPFCYRGCPLVCSEMWNHHARHFYTTTLCVTSASL